MATTAAVAGAWGAYHAQVMDERLRSRYHSRRAAARATASVPEELRQHVPEPPDWPPGLPDLLLPDEYDRRRVPSGVWWVNLYDAEQVRTVGPDRIRTAGWAALEERADGAWLLAATHEPLDADRPDHIVQLARLIDHIGLADLQRRYQFEH